MINNIKYDSVSSFPVDGNDIEKLIEMLDSAYKDIRRIKSSKKGVE